MHKYVRRTLCIYTAAAAVWPLSISGNEAPAAVPSPPSHDPHWHGAAGAGVYGQHAAAPPYSPGSIPPPHPPPHHGYMPPVDPSGAQHQPADHKDASSPHATGKHHFPLWEQSSGAVDLPTHSWQPPLAHEHLSHWDVAMSTLPSEDHVLLVPSEANRTGQFWHRNAIPSDQFEVQFGFGVHGKDQEINEAAGGAANGVGLPDGFAFWYVYEPYANVYPRTPEEQAAWNLIGYKSNPKGLGVVFKTLDKTGHINPSITCIHNTEDGKQIADDIPSSSALFYQYRNLHSPVLFRVIVNQEGVTAQIRESMGSAWVTACTLDHVILRPHGFIGFTGFNKPAAPQSHQPAASHHQQQHSAANTPKTGDQVLLYFVKTWSLSPLPHSDQSAAPATGATAAGSHVPPHAAAYPGYDYHMHADPHAHDSHLHHYDTHAAGYHHPYGYTSDPNYANYSQAEQAILRLVTSVSNQLSMLSIAVSNLHHEVRGLFGEEGPDAVKSIKSELTGFKDLFKRHSQQHTSALNTIHRHVEDKAGGAKDGHSPILSQLTDLSSQLERGIAIRQGHSFILSLAAIILVVLFAMCSWRKFQDIEKKHML